MSFIVNQNFDLKNRQKDFVRQELTLEDLPNTRDSDYPDDYQVVIKGRIFIFNSQNSKIDTYGRWREFKSGSGGSSSADPDSILTYTKSKAAEKGEANLPDKYILIPDKETDLQQTTIGSRYVAKDGTYVDILFSALRQLQNEVAKLRNTFKYGVTSYTDEHTAMSGVVNGIKDPSEEPLWAIDPEGLSLIYEVPMDQTNTLEGGTIKITEDGKISVEGTTTFSNEDVTSCTDGRLAFYFTTSNTNIKLTLNDQNDSDFIIDLSKFTNISGIINTLVVVNRKTKSSSKEYVGTNYVYIVIENQDTDATIVKGYYNNGKLQESKNELDQILNFGSIELTDLDISKLNCYSKYYDFSSEVVPSKPNEESYKYDAAHITIRSVKTKSVADGILKQLLTNELVFCEDTGKLYIKTNNKLKQIAGSSSSGGDDPVNPDTPDDEGMTETEVLDLLKKQGIIKEDGGDLTITGLSDITFIHQDTNKKYKFFTDASGELVSQEVPDDSSLLSSRVTNSGVNLTTSGRGFIGQLRVAEYNKANPASQLIATANAGLYSDRVKIGAFYAPLITDEVFGCTRAFVELENTSDSDFCLNGCYLHYTRPTKGVQTVYHLPLTGTIKAGSTYVIAGKRYAYDTDENSYIKVDSFDQEWYVDGELIDFTIDTTSSCGNGFALTYGKPELKSNDRLWKLNDKSNSEFTNTTKFPNLYEPEFIDAIYFHKGVLDESNVGYWAKLVLTITSNSMYKNTFELDPAQQAYQACNTADGSRARWASNNDVWVVDLSNPTIKFPHSEEEYNISNFSPKASKLQKNVCTDKTKLDISKPNMVTCAFGLNIHTTRTFNWISVGYHDEYVWLRKKGATAWSKFESYKAVSAANTAASTYPRRKEYSLELNNAAYSRIISRFPADNTQYTSHKCVVELATSAPSSAETWEYVVGRADANGNPDSYISDVMTFTLYPTTYKPVIYQTTDQQGFDWLQYQVWAAAANKLYEKMHSDMQSENIIPILVNTGDMTQNGTRINEWVDYYNAGKILFKEFEQMNVVGNNDLCGTNVLDLGTGDDVGKSNSFYFQVFYCYDIDESTFTPIVNGKYIPSLYYFDSNDYRFVMINSEITMVNCKDWFKLTDGDDVVNIYTGWTVGENNRYVGGFTSIYTMLYKMLTTSKKCIAMCHEMPFTVITNSSIVTGQGVYSRSVGPNNGSLIGSHCNQLTNTDNGHGIYWLSRLLEQKNVKLMLGGHKHTYACTYPVREYFFFGDGKNSKDNFSEYSMSETLENDDVTFVSSTDGLNYSKFPLTKREAMEAPQGTFYPYTSAPNLEGGITYFMCQATGFKLTSNKELPSANQKFSLAIPQTSVDASGADKANGNQQYPMFSITKLNGDQYTVKLCRITNILADSNHKFTQDKYSTSAMAIQYFSQVSDNNYGEWGNSETTMLTL